MKELKLDDMTVRFDDSQETKDAVFETVMAYFTKHESFCGDSIGQNDGPIIDAHQVMINIAEDVIKFDVEYD